MKFEGYFALCVRHQSEQGSLHRPTRRPADAPSRAVSGSFSLFSVGDGEALRCRGRRAADTFRCSRLPKPGWCGPGVSRSAGVAG